MVNYKDLRIGNLIEYKGTSWDVIALAENDIVVDCFAGEGSCFDGIKITDEILINSGFKKVKTYYKHENDNGESEFRFFIHDDRLHVSVGGDDLGILIAYMKYVHELQNFLYTTVDEEIEIRLKPNSETTVERSDATMLKKDKKFVTKEERLQHKNNNKRTVK